MEDEAIFWHIKRCFDCFLEGTGDNQTKSFADKDQILSLFLMLSWLQDNLLTNPIVIGKIDIDIIAKMKGRFKNIKSKNLKEECDLCGELIQFSSVKSCSCSRNHTFERCSFTMLPLSSNQNYICYGCRRKVRKDLQKFWWLPGVPYRCSFCNSIIRKFVEF